jgi:hypothetical protein
MMKQNVNTRNLSSMSARDTLDDDL